MSRSLWAVVVLCGLAAFGVTLGASVVMGYSVRLAVLAAAVAAVGLLPRQRERGWLIAALAVSGSIDALASWIWVGSLGWAHPVIFTLNALQTVAAVGALLCESGMPPSTSVDSEDYSAYASFAAAYQAYVMQYQQTPMSYYTGGQGDAAAHAFGAGAAADTAHQSNALRTRYAEYNSYSTAERAGDPHREQTATQPPDPGLPDTNYGWSQPRSSDSQHKAHGAASGD